MGAQMRCLIRAAVCLSGKRKTLCGSAKGFDVVAKFSARIMVSVSTLR